MRIGELAQATGLSTHTLRYYEREGLLPQRLVQRRGNNYRDYSEEAQDRIWAIGILSSAGFTLSEAGVLLTRWDEGRLTPEEGTSLLLKKAATIDARITELQQTKAALINVLGAHMKETEEHAEE